MHIHKQIFIKKCMKLKLIDICRLVRIKVTKLNNTK